VDPPRLGSFQGVLLTEVDRRNRNCRFAEVQLVVNVLALMLGASDPQLGVIDEWLGAYSAELYQDVYAPEYTIAQRAALQRKRAEERKKAAETARLVSKVEKFG
jgi:hypothetical protein